MDIFTLMLEITSALGDDATIRSVDLHEKSEYFPKGCTVVGTNDTGKFRIEYIIEDEEASN